MSGIRNIKQISKQYKEAEIYFHQDLDGVTSCLAMKNYLETNGISVPEVHIIQYGSLEYNIKNITTGRLPVIVDFAHVKDMFVIATDHHDKQSGAKEGMSTSFKTSSSNVETISGEISNFDVFTFTDIDLIKTVDSADYSKYRIKPEHIQRSHYKYYKERTSQQNRFLLGLVVNRLMLALKNKRISVDSLDGSRKHQNRNLLECLVLDSKPSLIALYKNIKHYINTAISYEWNSDLKTYHDPKRLPSPNQLYHNLNNYVLSRQEFINLNGRTLKNKEIDFDPTTKILRQFDIGETFKTGSYDRYVPFRNFPETEWLCTVFKMGLIQVSGNPFKDKKVNIHLGNITKELLTKWKKELSAFRISISSIKKINESESYKLKKKYSNFQPVGFKFNDLLTFYKDDVCYQPNRKSGDLKTIAKLDLNENTNPDVIFIKNTMDKLYDTWTFDERQEMCSYKINGLAILEVMSGGHASITNIHGVNFLDERRDAIQKYFGHITLPTYNLDGTVTMRYVRNAEDLMLFFADQYLELLKNNLNGIEATFDETMQLCGSTSQTIG
jgi:hypothetical protein